MLNLQEGTISSKELIEKFGTMKQKEAFLKNKKLNIATKQRILKKANKFCNIEDLGQGKFAIHKVYSMLKDDHILQLKNGLYQYMAPLILSKLIQDCDENGKISLSFLGWIRKFDMINDNYGYMKYHQDISSEKLEINPDIMWEYFDKINECLKHYFHRCLEIMQNPNELDLIDYSEVKMVKKGSVSLQGHYGNYSLIGDYIHEIISDEDNRYVLDCEQEAKIIADIQRPQEKFYGTKLYIYNSYMKQKLAERDIICVYKVYNIFFKDYNKVCEALKKFEYQNDCNFVSDFNKYFIEYVNNKAKLRQNKEIEKSQDETIDIKFLEQHRLLETYLSEIHKLSDMTLRQDSENIIDKIRIESTTDDFLNEFNINIKKGE